MVTFWGVLLVLGVLAVARYGADSRGDADPTGRDPAWSSAPHREHTPRDGVTALARWVAAHRRCWELYDAALRPWEQESSGGDGARRAELTRRS